MKQPKWNIVWGYCTEIILTALIYGAVYASIDSNVLAKFINKTAGQWLGLVGGVLALNAAIFICFIQSLNSEFGDRLHWRKGDLVFEIAFAWVLIADCIAFVSLIVVGYSIHPFAVRVAWVATIYVAVMEWTCIANFIAAVRLGQVFRKTRNRVPAEGEPAEVNAADNRSGPDGSTGSHTNHKTGHDPQAP